MRKTFCFWKKLFVQKWILSNWTNFSFFGEYLYLTLNLCPGNIWGSDWNKHFHDRPDMGSSRLEQQKLYFLKNSRNFFSILALSFDYFWNFRWLSDLNSSLISSKMKSVSGCKYCKCHPYFVRLQRETELNLQIDSEKLHFFLKFLSEFKYDIGSKRLSDLDGFKFTIILED